MGKVGGEMRNEEREIGKEEREIGKKERGKEERGIRNCLSNNRNSTIKLAAAGCDETGSAKGFPETRKAQASDRKETNHKKSAEQGFLFNAFTSRGDWIRTSDHTPPRRVL